MPISPFTDWSSIGKLPTRLDLEEEEVIAIDHSNSDSDYVSPEPVHEPASPRPEPRGSREEEPKPVPPREEGPGAPNILVILPGTEEGVEKFLSSELTPSLEEEDSEETF